MKTIRIKKVEYQCPESWDDITLKQVIEVGKISVDAKNVVDAKLAILSGYAGIPLHVLKTEKIDRMVELFQAISFISTDVPAVQQQQFDFNGHTYYMGQNLLEAEFQDFISIQNAVEMYSGDTVQALPIIVAVMAKRKKADGTLETLDDYSLIERSIEFLELPITIANGVAFFFTNSIRLQENLSQFYSNPQELVTRELDEVQNMLKPVAGMAWHTRLLYGMLRRYTKSIKKDVIKSFTS